MDIKTFYKSWLQNPQLAQPSQNAVSPVQVSVAAIRSVAVSLSKDDAKSLTKQVNDLLASYDVITAISDRVGEPRPDESEDEFVARAKDIARQVLMRTLNGAK
jgi:hypothetical protein